MGLIDLKKTSETEDSERKILKWSREKKAEEKLTEPITCNQIESVNIEIQKRGIEIKFEEIITKGLHMQEA